MEKMVKLNCIIVDDEELARDILEAYAKKIPELIVITKCKNTNEASLALSNNTIDLIFLDIEMPNQSGINFLKTNIISSKIILTTAYAEYALEGYELKIADYLLKPIGFERFECAVRKVIELYKTEQKAQAYETENTFEQQTILIKDGLNLHKIYLKDIDYISAEKEYVLYHLKDRKILELKSLSKLYEALPAEYFIKIHRSYIVAKKAIQEYKHKSLVLISGQELPIGKTYLQQVKKVIWESKF